MNKLREIFQHKREEVDRAKAAIPLAELRRMAGDAPDARPFRKALADSSHPVALIAEVKKASPSKGVIREFFDPEFVATAYRESGADCLSVLTEERFFAGSRANLEIARAASGLPCLRKDFILDEYQIWESRAWGADCILLIVAGLDARSDETGLKALRDLAIELGMDVLVEVHSETELERAQKIGADLIGVNNRNLEDMSTDVRVSEILLPRIARPDVGLGNLTVAVSESALETRTDIERVQAAGARAVLIGTTFCSSPDITGKVRDVMGWDPEGVRP